MAWLIQHFASGCWGSELWSKVLEFVEGKALVSVSDYTVGWAVDKLNKTILDNTVRPEGL